jgi:hypothetical protein
MTDPYTVRGSKVNVVAVIRHLGEKFKLSRPVDIGGQRRRHGWMLSHEGHAMVLINDCEEAVAKAYCAAEIAKFTKRDWLLQRLAEQHAAEPSVWRTAE